METFDNPAFSCALIAGDAVLLHLLHRLGYLSNSTVRVFFLDTLHLFEETHSFLHRLERSLDFSAHVFSPSIASSKAELEQHLGADVWKHQPEKYDRICKVEPFQRALNELEVDCLVNGRRRDHGHERAHLELFDAASPGEPVKLQPLAYWEFRDCFDYLDKYGVEHHPLHDQGYPSVGAPTRQRPGRTSRLAPFTEDRHWNARVDSSAGDVHSTVQVPKEKWFEYAGERSGRFQGMTNPDGSVKTECGIHSASMHSQQGDERDLWPAENSSVRELDPEEAREIFNGGSVDALMVVYAPWCAFCQALEPAFEALAAELPKDAVLGKLRGDTRREFVQREFGVSSFPTIIASGRRRQGHVRYESEQRNTAQLKRFFDKVVSGDSGGVASTE